MSTTGLFTIGVLVTLIVTAAMGLLIYAAILDGRDAAVRQAAEPKPPGPQDEAAQSLVAAPDTLTDVVNHHLVPPARI